MTAAEIVMLAIGVVLVLLGSVIFVRNRQMVPVLIGGVMTAFGAILVWAGAFT